MSEVSTSNGIKFDDDETSVVIDGNDLNDLFDQQQRDDPLLLYKHKQIGSSKSYIQSFCRHEQALSSSLELQLSQSEINTTTRNKGRGKRNKRQEKTAKKISKITDEIDSEPKYSFVPEKRCHVNKKVRVGPLTLSKRMSWKLAKSSNALDSPFFVCQLNFSPTKISRRRQVVVRNSSKPPRKSNRRTFGLKGRKLPTQR